MRTLSRLVCAALWPAIFCGAAASCVSPDSPLLQESAEGCDEIDSADLNAVDVDPAVRRVMLASVDFSVAVQASRRTSMSPAPTSRSTSAPAIPGAA